MSEGSQHAAAGKHGLFNQLVKPVQGIFESGLPQGVPPDISLVFSCSAYLE